MNARAYRIVFVTECWDNSSPARRVKLWSVVEKASGKTVFGPANWKACCAWKQGWRPGEPLL